jgi:DNA-binding transcriptional LysR family regulator
VSHPTVGRRIKALEDEAQQALFRRTSDGLVLTDAGDRVMTLAEAMEDSALAMERRLAGNHERLEGYCASPQQSGLLTMFWHLFWSN